MSRELEPAPHRRLTFRGALLLAGLCGLARLAAGRDILPLDDSWTFQRGDPADAARPDSSGAGWTPVTLPHDWSIAGPFAATNRTGGAGAFLPSGVAWYRHDFSTPPAAAGRRVFVEFDGVMQNSDVWCNGVHLGRRPNGYASFEQELTGCLLPAGGGVNRLAVRVDTSAQPASRWYSGAGVYRHARLVITDPVHVAWQGVFVSTPRVTARQAVVRLQTTVTNQTTVARRITVQQIVLSPAGLELGSVTATLSVAAGGMARADQELTLDHPPLWDPATPRLCRAVSRLLAGATVLDETSTTFGIRDARFTATRGFVLNGRKLMLKGVCLHEDGGAFGAAVPLAIWEQRLTALRTLGVNAIRTAHNPPDPGFLDLCDRLGFLVMDEFFDCWTVGKNPADYHLYFRQWSDRDAADTIRRDRNHPSVILYSIGNEIHDTPWPDLARPIARRLVRLCHENDPTRPVTQALFRPNTSGDYTNGLADLLDVIGTNYRDQELLAAQRARPGREIINTEQIHDRKAWLELRDHPSLAGQFLWTGVDYLGESRRWPLVGHASGLLDRTGMVKPMALERQSWWSETPVLHLVRRTAPDDRMPQDPGYGGAELHTQVQFADWSPRQTNAHPETVEAYSNCREVELFLNGRSLGVQTLPADASPRVWSVPFAPGILRAVGRDGGAALADDELRTAGPAAAIRLEAPDPLLRHSWESAAIVRATVVDASGVAVPRSQALLTFQVSGPAVIAAVDNGDAASHEPFQSNRRRAYHGVCTAFIKAAPSPANAPIRVTAQAAGLAPGVIELRLTDEAP